MGAASNCTCVHFGTTWDDTTLLEEVKQTNLELERKDGIKRHFRYDWQEVAKYNADYLAYVEAEKARLGETHPLFLTQYCLQTVHGSGFLHRDQQAQLQGKHSRRSRPEEGKIYVAGIDLAGEAENDGGLLPLPHPHCDSTVVTIGELDYSSCDVVLKQPVVRIVEHYRWTGKKHVELYAQLVDLLQNVWHCRRVVVDATGIGQPVSSFLKQTLGNHLVPFVFTAPSKSELGFNLLAAINCGRLKMYAGDGSTEYQEFWSQIDKAKSVYRPSRIMDFFVDPSRGQDDFLMSLALLIEASARALPRHAIGR